MDNKKIILFLYKLRYVIYIVIFVFLLYWAFNNLNEKKQNLYDDISSYKKEIFLIQNGRRKTNTLTQNYIKNVFSRYETNLDYVENKSGIYYLKATNVDPVSLGNVVYTIENDGFEILYLKAQDYSGKFHFDVRMEIK